MTNTEWQQMIRLTIRATDDAVTPILLKLMQEKLAAGIVSQSRQDELEMPSQQEASESFANVMVL